MRARSPTDMRPPRIGPLARLPVFYALAGKRAVVAGGSAPAAWKAELLSAAGAQVDVYAIDPGEEIIAVAADPPGGAIILHHACWRAEDLAGAALAVGAFDEETEAARFASAARAAGVPVNVIDKPAYGDFAFGAIVNRSPLVIGVSTDGAAPVFAQAIRAKLEAVIPQGFARWADVARDWRPRLKTAGLSFAARRKFWQIFTAFAVSHPERKPEPSDYAAFLAASCKEEKSAELGSVTLVGAGPGDPELLTLRAVRALQSADVILIDDLVSPAILDFARREAKKMLVGKTGFGPSCKQAEINALMITLAKAGKRVVRLKGGDPMIFGRAGEEIAACRAAGIAVEIVPGITAAQGVASRLAISLTQRRAARRVQYVTGHAANGKLPHDFDWKMLADPTATTVVYMPRKTIGEMAARAIANGLDATTPAVAVINATRPDEAIVAATLAEIGDRLDRLPAEGPAIVVIGLVLQELNLRGQSDDRSASPETVTRQCAQGGDAVLFYRPPLRMTSP